MRHITDPALMRDRLQKHSTDCFRLHKGVFTAEVSSFRENPHARIIFRDSLLSGFILVSSVTNKEIVFCFEREDKRDGETCGWWYLPLEGQDRRAAGLKVLIIND